MESINIKLTPATAGAPVIERTTTNPAQLFEQLDRDTYQLEVTSASYNPLNQVLILDDNKTLNLTLTHKIVEPVITWQSTTRTRVKPFGVVSEYNPDLLPSESYTRIVGINGVETQTFEQKYIDGFATNEERNLSNWILTTPATNQINVVGTKESSAVNLLNNSNVFSVGSNNLLFNGVQTTDPLNITYQEIFKWENDGRIRWFTEMVQAHQEYTITFKIRKKTGTFHDIGGYLGLAWESAIQKIYKDGIEITGDWTAGVALSNTTTTQTYTIHLTITGDVGAMNEFTIEPNHGTHASVTYFIEGIALHQGHLPPGGG